MTDEPSPESAPPADAPVAVPDIPTPEVPPGRGGETSRTRAVQYKGADLDAERGPGLGCFWVQTVVLVVLVVLTPVSVSLGWPSEVSAVLLFVTIGLLLLVGQTVIFLLRLVAADRRGRRRPLASGTKTVGELEDERQERSAGPVVATTAGPERSDAGRDGDDDVRQ